MRHVEYITFHNTELRVEYDYHPAEPALKELFEQLAGIIAPVVYRPVKRKKKKK